MKQLFFILLLSILSFQGESQLLSLKQCIDSAIQKNYTVRMAGYDVIQANEKIVKIMQVKMKHLMPVMMEGQQKGIFTNAITTEELMHIIMGTFRLQMFKWRIANFKFDIKRNGDNMLQSILTLIKMK
jgi:hypothetical protein